MDNTKHEKINTNTDLTNKLAFWKSNTANKIVNIKRKYKVRYDKLDGYISNAEMSNKISEIEKRKRISVFTDTIEKYEKTEIIDIQEAINWGENKLKLITTQYNDKIQNSINKHINKFNELNAKNGNTYKLHYGGDVVDDKVNKNNDIIHTIDFVNGGNREIDDDVNINEDTTENKTIHDNTNEEKPDKTTTVYNKPDDDEESHDANKTRCIDIITDDNDVKIQNSHRREKLVIDIENTDEIKNKIKINNIVKPIEKNNIIADYLGNNEIFYNNTVKYKKCLEDEEEPEQNEEHLNEEVEQLNAKQDALNGELGQEKEEPLEEDRHAVKTHGGINDEGKTDIIHDKNKLISNEIIENELDGIVCESYDAEYVKQNKLITQRLDLCNDEENDDIQKKLIKIGENIDYNLKLDQIDKDNYDEMYRTERGEDDDEEYDYDLMDKILLEIENGTGKSIEKLDNETKKYNDDINKTNNTVMKIKHKNQYETKDGYEYYTVIKRHKTKSSKNKCDDDHRDILNYKHSMLKNVEKFKNYIREIELKNNKKRAKKTQKQYDYTKQKLNVCYDETVELIKKIKRHVNKMANKTIKNRDYKIILDGMNSFDEVLNFNQDEHDAKIKKIHKDYIRRKRQHHTLKNV